VWQPLSKAHRLLLGGGPGNIGPYWVRNLDLYSRGSRSLPMPCIPETLCRDLRTGCIPSRKILSSCVQKYLTSLTTSRITSKKGTTLEHATLSHVDKPSEDEVPNFGEKFEKTRFIHIFRYTTYFSVNPLPLGDLASSSKENNPSSC
jgi:hypothetical protein